MKTPLTPLEQVKQYQVKAFIKSLINTYNYSL